MDVPACKVRPNTRRERDLESAPERPERLYVVALVTLTWPGASPLLAHRIAPDRVDPLDQEPEFCDNIGRSDAVERSLVRP